MSVDEAPPLHDPFRFLAAAVRRGRGSVVTGVAPTSVVGCRANLLFPGGLPTDEVELAGGAAGTDDADQALPLLARRRTGARSAGRGLADVMAPVRPSALMIPCQ